MNFLVLLECLALYLKKININDILTRAVNFYKMSSKNRIELKFSNKLKMINGDEEQLNRVFINLIKNSEDSINDIKGKNKHFKGKIDVEISDNSDYIIVEISDNGIGIEDTTKIMTPYFTTKKNGTGLGLPIVRKIINEHSGEITILNQNTEGVKVTITLPTKN